MKGFWRFLIAKSEGRNSKNNHISIFDFHSVAKNIER
jgi:hypothetical protein